VSRSPADVAEDLAAALTELAGVEREMGALEGRRMALEARVAALRAERAGLPFREQAGSVEDSMFTPETHALATSYGRAKKWGNRLVKAAGHKKMTLDDLVEALKAKGVKTSKAALSASQRPKRRDGAKDASSRPIRGSVADAIAKLIDYPATERNYPAGIIRK